MLLKVAVFYSLWLLLLFSCPVVSNSLQPMHCSMLGLSVPHHLPKFAQVYVLYMGDTIQPPHPLMPSFPSVFNLSQHQGLFQWVSCSYPSDYQNIGTSASASVLPTSIQSWFPLRLTSLFSLLPERLSGVFSSTTVWSHQFFTTLPSLRSSSHNHMWHWENYSLDYKDICWQSHLSAFSTLSRFAMAYLPRCRCLLISWLQWPFAVILEHKKRNYVITSTFPPPLFAMM